MINEFAVAPPPDLEQTLAQLDAQLEASDAAVLDALYPAEQEATQ